MPIPVRLALKSFLIHSIGSHIVSDKNMSSNIHLVAFLPIQSLENRAEEEEEG